METIPRFNEYLLEELITKARPLKEWRQDAWTLRDTLILYSVHFRSTVQELAEISENEALEKPIFKVFANNLRRAGNEFLQKHMFTLQIIDLNSKSTEDNKETVPHNKETVPYSKDTIPYKKGTAIPCNKEVDNLKGQIKKLFPSIMNEFFKVSSCSEFGLLEFYNQEGDIIPLTDSEMIKEAFGNKEQVLKEQLEQLELESSRKQQPDDDEEDYETRESTIKQAIKDVKIELDRLKKTKDLMNK